MRKISQHDEDMRKCREWIANYVRPSEKINHIYTSLELWQLAVKDTNSNITHEQFKFLMRTAGYEPADVLAESCEYRISNAGLRRRPKARVGGWLPSLAGDKMTRFQ